jgi:transcriptional regulator with XRE-family HTH domain
MSLGDLAAAVGVSRTTVRRWEACTHDPGPEAAARIAVVTGVPVSKLLAPSRDVLAAGWPTSRRAA